MAGGGKEEGPHLASAELYDPRAGTWSRTGSMSVGRARHTATLLNDGRVLVVGGIGRITSAEVYDPSAGTWSLVTSMPEGRGARTATLLKSGQVFVTGGIGNLSAAEAYDPATDSWISAGEMTVARYYHSATLLNDGRLLIAGGLRRIHQLVRAVWALTRLGSSSHAHLIAREASLGGAESLSRLPRPTNNESRSN